jgi:hypothetical protein
MRAAITLLFILASGCISYSVAQSNDNPIKVELHGYVNYEVVHDSRQVKAAREGDILIFPMPVTLDAAGNDIYNKGELSMFTFDSRLRTDISGPKIGSFNTSGLIEVDFMGSSDAAPNTIRLRHAFLKLTNTKTEWVLGQFWHPMFVTECFPAVVTCNAGLPIHLLSRNPQIRFTWKPTSSLKLMLAALSQRDYVSSGPSGNSSVYIKRAEVPELQSQITFKTSENHTIGATAGYKEIVPRIISNTGYATDERLGSYNFNLFSRLSTQKFTWLVQGIYGQNLSHLLMLGGYAVKEITNPEQDIRTYTNIETAATWTDLTWKFNKIQVGIFAGFSKNMGGETVTNVDNGVYGLGYNLDGKGNSINYLYNVSPRIAYINQKLKFAVEWGHLTAAYGQLNNNLKVASSSEVSNNRLVFSTTYSF